MEPTVRGRLKMLAGAQLPLLVGTAFVAALVALSTPIRSHTGFLTAGLVVIGLVSIVAAIVPWERRNKNLLIGVAVVDIVGVALIRTDLISILPSAGMLAIFPILWLSYSFNRAIIAVAIAGAFFISTLGFVIEGTWPSTVLEWANIVTLPVLIVGVAIVVNGAAARLRRNRRNLKAASDAQAEALRQSMDNELLSRAILDTVNAGVAFYDSDSRLVVANRLASDMVGIVGFRLDEPPYAGEDVLAADRSTPIPFDEQIIPRALRGEIVKDHLEWLGPADQQIAILASANRVHRADGALLGTVIAAYDITELAHAITLREEFLSTVSHELRTPLTNIIGYLELLEDGLDPADSASEGYLAVINRNVDSLNDRIKELLAATTTDAPLDRVVTDVSSLVESVVSGLASTAEGRGQLFLVSRSHGGQADPKTETETPADTTALIDADRLGRALHEVIDNALKFSPPDSTVTITQQFTSDSAMITVSDTGPGLDRGEQSQMFDRFYRTPHARSNAIQGFGLGLTLAKNTVAAHGGRVHVTSAPGEGTALTITLPRGS
ncbi:cell wall metabolism sensor histidine kinase WalK [Agreia sp. COWG]|uniref:sensor histidine kinase n=1 Tax=Agreia sp. COWG TaxID=2773266 RepID=UPI001928B424|nr:ATP-binding protein [Agreia sp. COWG]